jgi:transposase-like protein
MLREALEAEVADYIGRHRGLRDERGHALVVRNGRARARRVTMGAGTVQVRAPRVHDRRRDQRFTSAILPPWLRRSPKVAEVLPVLYLRGLSTGDFRPAMTVLLGEETSGLSASSINRMTGIWEAEYEAFRRRDLSGVDYVYVWVDGIHVNVRLGEPDRLCLLVMIGARPDGTKELIAVEDGYRESTESWADVLRDLRRRGMRAPVLAIGDGALGFWAAVRDVWPETREQRDWVHRIANVLDKLPKRLQGRAKAKLREIMRAPTRRAAEAGIDRFREDYGAKYPKAVDSLTRRQDALLTFYDFPAQHWKHIRTSNPIESTFATVRLRQRVTKGPGSRGRGLLMAYKLLRMAEERWRRLDAQNLLPLVRAGVRFIDGEQSERDETEETLKEVA